MKKTLLSGIALLLLLTLFTNVTRAETKVVVEEAKSSEVDNQESMGILSSEYISSYAVSVIPSSGGKLAVNFEVTGTSYMDKIGVNYVYLQEYRNGIWYTVRTYTGYKYDVTKYINEFIYYGVVGRTYRAKAAFYAEKDGGSDTVYKTSSSTIAK